MVSLEGEISAMLKEDAERLMKFMRILSTWNVGSKPIYLELTLGLFGRLVESQDRTGYYDPGTYHRIKNKGHYQGLQELGQSDPETNVKILLQTSQGNMIDYYSGRD